MNSVNARVMTRQRGQHHGDLRRALLDAALGLLREGSSTDELTLRGVARRAGVSPAAPYHHFPSKDALLDAVALEGFRRLREAQEELPVEDPADAVARLTCTYIEFARSHRAHYGLMFAALVHAGAAAEVDPALAAAAVATFDHLAGAVAATGIEPEAARDRALQIWALAHGVVALIDTVGALDQSFTPERVLDRTAEVARRIATDG
ncbi:TetR/AcrR family transcriptional regulator [soil metagenome]